MEYPSPVRGSIRMHLRLGARKERLPPAILARPSGPPVAIGMMILLSPEAKYTIP
jgi:hypothetical protein